MLPIFCVHNRCMQYFRLRLFIVLLFALLILTETMEKILSTVDDTTFGNCAYVRSG